ncbi:ImmA/IrrE family metallo-endopeptidase [Aureimonas phyllosphaerae]|uniref:ImmA/IrrE family metallo-endopeptidase n=1 Tax=Aureimonas phyllosphaerae TaxID=1166078 RepID=UPI003A5BFBFB
MLMSVTRPNYARVMSEVKRLHGEFAIANPPVDPRVIAEGVGVGLRFVRFEGANERVSGFFDCEDNMIFVNKDEAPLRQTFTIAHELGHAVLHREWAQSSEYRVLLRDQDYAGDEVHEKEANAFAAHLLVPRRMLDRFWKAASVEELSRLFAVSVPMIRNRLKFEYGV